MTFLYYGLPPALTSASLVSLSLTTTDRLSRFLDLAVSSDLSSPAAIGTVLSDYSTLPLRAPFYLYSWNPEDLSSLPLAPQVRFPFPGTYVDLLNSSYAIPLANLFSSLSITPVPASFSTAISSLRLALANGDGVYDRFSFEAKYLLLWSIYPPIPSPSLSTPL